MVTEADTVVPLGPITSKGRVMVRVGGLPELAVSEMLALAALVESTTLIAVSVTV